MIPFVCCWIRMWILNLFAWSDVKNKSTLSPLRQFKFDFHSRISKQCFYAHPVCLESLPYTHSNTECSMNCISLCFGSEQNRLWLLIIGASCGCAHNSGLELLWPLCMFDRDFQREGIIPLIDVLTPLWLPQSQMYWNVNVCCVVKSCESISVLWAFPHFAVLEAAAHAHCLNHILYACVWVCVEYKCPFYYFIIFPHPKILSIHHFSIFSWNLLCHSDNLSF